MAKTNIVRWGNSQGVRLPRYLLDSVSLSDNDTVELIAANDSIIIKKAAAPKHRTLKERLAAFEGAGGSGEWDTGESVGSESLWEDEDRGV